MSRLVGYGVSQVPTNGMLGGMAYQDPINVTATNITVSGGTLNVGVGGTIITTTAGGLVGIGTTNPTSKLHTLVNTNTTNVCALFENSNTGGSALSELNIKAGTNKILFGLGGSGTIYNAYLGADQNQPFAIFTRNSYLAFETNNAERVRISSSGNVGIGTINPSNRMHLYSTTDGAELLQLEIGGQPANTQKGSIIWRATQTGGSSAKLASVGSTAINNWGGELVFSTKPANGSPNDNIVERVRINASGNVGVGYDNPSYKLAVNGDIFAGGNIIMNNNEQQTTMFSNTASNVSNNTWYTVTNFAFQYNLIAFLLFVAFENSAGDGNNATALFMSPTTTAYAGGGAAPFKIAGATALEAQIVNSSPYNLQVRITTGADGGNTSRLRWWGFAIPGN